MAQVLHVPAPFPGQGSHGEEGPALGLEVGEGRHGLGEGRGPYLRLRVGRSPALRACIGTTWLSPGESAGRDRVFQGRRLV